MKKIFVLAALMLVTAFTFVACDKKNEPAKWETPTVLTNTEWDCEGVFTLIFETETTGTKITKVEIPGSPTSISECTFNYTYANGEGSYTTNGNLIQEYRFTIDGGKLTEYDETDYEQEYFRKK